MLADPFNVFSHISWVCFNYVVAQDAFQYGFRSIVWLDASTQVIVKLYLKITGTFLAKVGG